jgi:uncharacterized protein
MFKNILPKAKDSLQKLMRLNATPHQIAMGFAVGAFIGVFPSFGLGGFIAVGLSYIFRLNYTAAIIGSMVIMNPLTSPFFWALSAVTGALIFGENPSVFLSILRQHKDLLNSLGRFSVIYLAGSVAVSTVVACICYFVTKKLALNYRSKNETGN